jgi:hypothetical protein
MLCIHAAAYFYLWWLVFISRRNWFQKLFENAFEILEKEKEIEIFFLLSFRPECRCCLSFAGPLGLLTWLASSAQQVSYLLYSLAPCIGPAQLIGWSRPQPRPSSLRFAAIPGPCNNGVVILLSLITEPVTARWSSMSFGPPLALYRTSSSS